jgi:EAL domain-containing protein (putative c-di-GMP-specific phosphodiesterase class I)
MGELRNAIERDELVLHYQPKLDIKTRSVTEVEALVRWQHLRHGLMLPTEFIPLAERTGLIKSLTLWVLKRALQQIRIWNQSGSTINVSVNLSAQDLLNLELPDIIAGLLASYEASPQQLVLEITESAIMADHVRALEILTRLAEMSVRLSIDDFGTGYSSLAYLSKLPVSEIKIDQSFVMAMGDNKQDAMIVRATIDLAHNLGLKVTAEGVERAEILGQLERLGCDAIQGFHISGGLDADAFADWLGTSHWSVQQLKG